MHYLGDAAISNYRSAYELPYVVGAALIAVTASTTALALFFVFDASWTNAWWRRLGCAMVLAGAVSGMHWCAAVGTKYKLLHLSSRDNPSRGLLIIVVICLVSSPILRSEASQAITTDKYHQSVSACVVMVASAAYSSWVRRAYATKAQQVVLAAAVFDDKGRIMVNQDGLLPSEVVTDEFIPKVVWHYNSLIILYHVWKLILDRQIPTCLTLHTRFSTGCTGPRGTGPASPTFSAKCLLTLAFFRTSRIIECGYS